MVCPDLVRIVAAAAQDSGRGHVSEPTSQSGSGIRTQALANQANWAARPHEISMGSEKKTPTSDRDCQKQFGRLSLTFQRNRGKKIFHAVLPILQGNTNMFLITLCQKLQNI